MVLKGRLGLLAGMVPECGCLCDIGTDHAYVPVYLVKKGVCERAIASDVRKGPVETARKNVEKNALTDRIEIRLGSGLDPIMENEADCIVIAGMGGLLIKEILKKGISKAKNAEAIILQPMNAIELLRKWLYENGFEIYDEGLSEEGRKIYNVLAARYTGRITHDEEIFYHIGRILIEKKDTLLKKYIAIRQRTLSRIIKEIRSNCDGCENHTLLKYEKLYNDMQKIIDSL